MFLTETFLKLWYDKMLAAPWNCFHHQVPCHLRLLHCLKVSTYNFEWGWQVIFVSCQIRSMSVATFSNNEGHTDTTFWHLDTYLKSKCCDLSVISGAGVTRKSHKTEARHVLEEILRNLFLHCGMRYSVHTLQHATV